MSKLILVDFIKSKRTTLILFAFSIFIYFLFSNHLPRSNFWEMFSLYSCLFSAYLVFNYQKLNWKLILVFGVAFRVVFLFTLPELSDDFYRFYWDGLQSLGGMSPFESLPSEVRTRITESVYLKLNSPNYYSVYPGINQSIYFLGAFFGKSLFGFVLVLKVLMLIVELGSFYFLYKLLKAKKKPLFLLSWYFLNPLIILEFVGNLHFEGFMLCAILGSLFFFSKANYFSSSVALGLACAIKIMPFIFVPLYFIKVKNSCKWLFVAVPPLVFMFSLIPFYHHEMFVHINESIQLYFGKFEFNSSLFLLFTWIGLPKVFLRILLIGGELIILFRAYKNKINLDLALVWLFTWYLLLSQSVHPWYVAGFLGVALLNNQRYIILWSFLIFCTYITYQTSDYEQQLWVNITEYIIVGSKFYFDVKREIKSGNDKKKIPVP